MVVVTLVHGTWGRGIVHASGDAPWTLADSALCRSLAEEFGDDLSLRGFQWSGRNTHTGRRSAAECLRASLEEAIETSAPNTTHVVVAHSHGGNVAIDAIGTPALRDRIAGVVCLATPFIVARERDIGPNPTSTFAAAVTALGFLLLWVANWMMPEAWSAPARFGVRAAIFIGLGAVFVSVARAVLGHSKRLLTELTPPLPTKERLLIIRSPGDEASAGLAVFQIVSQVTVRLFLTAEALYVAFEHFATRLAERPLRVAGFGLASLLLSVAPLIGYVELAGGNSGTWLGRAMLATWLVLFLVFAASLYLILPFLGPKGVALPMRLLVAAFLWPVMGVLSVLLLFPFGWQTALANLLLDVTTETTPIGEWEIHLVRPPTAEELGVPVPPLMHVVYENPRAVALLRDWIRAKVLAG